LITKEKKGNIDFNWLDTLPVIEDQADVRHVKTPYPLMIKIDGKQGKAVIRQEKGINKSNKLGEPHRGGISPYDLGDDND
jgi:hypothetical protein